MNSLKNLYKIHIPSFQEDLITWFKDHQRILPWRVDKNPYKIWVSEIMLQQTKVDTVIPYFNRFIKQYPTIEALAKAHEDDVLKAWEGLGYYSRARNLHAAVKEVVTKYDGEMPKNRAAMMTLKGIGPYTAGAILSIAFNLPEHAVDGNVMRVLSRILTIGADVTKASTRKIFEQAVTELISHDNPSYFNQGLMELGALICHPTSPNCEECPMNVYCRAYQTGIQIEYPVKSKKKRPRPVNMIAAVLTDEEGRLLIQRRPDEGLLANMWEFPNVEKHLSFANEKVQLKDAIETKYHIQVAPEAYAFSIEHIFTHLIWHIQVYKGTIQGELHETDDVKLVFPEQISEYAFPVSHQKIYHKMYSTL